MSARITRPSRALLRLVALVLLAGASGFERLFESHKKDQAERLRTSFWGHFGTFWPLKTYAWRSVFPVPFRFKS